MGGSLGESLRRLGIRWGWAGFAAVAVAWLTLRAVMAGPAAPVARLGAMPAFEMADQHGRAFGDRSLRDEVAVVDFFFASCTSSCPRLTAKMLGVQQAVEERERSLGHPLPVHLVSITLDPENDTPDVLAQYAKTHGADDARWSFLSGRSEDLDRVVVKGFKTTFERSDPSAGIATIMHGEWIVLVDPSGTIHGYYAANDPERMAALAQDAIRLAGGGAS